MWVYTHTTIAGERCYKAHEIDYVHLTSDAVTSLLGRREMEYRPDTQTSFHALWIWCELWTHCTQSWMGGTLWFCFIITSLIKFKVWAGEYQPLIWLTALVCYVYSPASVSILYERNYYRASGWGIQPFLWSLCDINWFMAKLTICDPSCWRHNICILHILWARGG